MQYPFQKEVFETPNMLYMTILQISENILVIFLGVLFSSLIIFAEAPSLFAESKNSVYIIEKTLVQN